MTDYFQVYCIASLVCGLILTFVMLKDPPDNLLPVIVFYFTVPIMPLLVVVIFPIAIYKTIEKAWSNEIRRRRLRVTKR